MPKWPPGPSSRPDGRPQPRGDPRLDRAESPGARSLAGEAAPRGRSADRLARSDPPAPASGDDRRRHRRVRARRWNRRARRARLRWTPAAAGRSLSRTLVTGATGFLGAHVTRLLVERGDAVRVLARPSSDQASLEGLDVDAVRGDVGDRGSVRR